MLIECDAGAEALEQATVTLRNTGSTVLFFTWSRVPRGETIVSANGASESRGASSNPGSGCEGARKALEAGGGVVEGGGGRHAHGDASGEVAVTRHAALQDPGGRFFCYQVGALCNKPYYGTRLWEGGRWAQLRDVIMLTAWSKRFVRPSVRVCSIDFHGGQNTGRPWATSPPTLMHSSSIS